MIHTSGENWDYQRPETIPTMEVWDLADEANEVWKAKVKAGARVVPFGFSRVLSAVDAEPLLWEGDQA